jgi:hypothetical protein
LPVHRQPPIHHARQSVQNPKALLFLIDYARQQRIKIWEEARVVEDDGDLITRLMPPGYTARRAGDPFHRLGLGRKLSAAHSATLRGRRRGGNAG